MAYEEHKNFDQFANPSKVTLWRYMRLNTLVKTIQEGSLRFTNITEWDDLREGHVEPFTQETLSSELGSPMCPQYIVDGFNNERFKAKHRVFANCWCVDDDEINLMWDSYGKTIDDNIGVAVKTTAETLYAAINDERSIYSAVVIYEKFPFTPKSGNIYIDCVVKALNYRFENELRLLYLGDDHDVNEKDKYVSVDISKLMTNIYINPYATDEDFDYVQSEIMKLGKNLDFNLRRSEIPCKPRKL